MFPTGSILSATLYGSVGFGKLRSAVVTGMSSNRGERFREVF